MCHYAGLGRFTVLTDGAAVMTESTRLDAIEIKLAHLEHSLQELGETVMRQQRDIEVLSERIRIRRAA